jgi:DNA-directed RNA polymerase specialized sigma24 family protein
MIEFLRSKIATLCVLVLALIAQLPHAAEVFMQAGAVRGYWAVLHGGAYAMALELAVLLFVVQGHRLASYAFAGVSVLVNLAYYAERVQLNSMHGLSAWLISIALPVAIALYSHAVADAKDTTHFDARAWALRAWAKLHSVAPLQNEVMQPTANTVQPTVQPVAPIVQPVIIEDVQPDDDEQPDPQKLAVQLQSEGLNKSQISERLGVHRNTVGKWLNGHSKVAV